ncbi:hypothetical protein DUI87_27331 [Hirundo rustica rustica]|uniref:MHC class I-like antigen recognition-like domain-containing protein n=1 Tax=Hirundo rustica rustica TaxID=333673 RepID=A0A3M0J5Q5_HIRRU|nr:hypothetical protein DUI87_27331 [Hirundo rustica rustica]
MAAGAEPGSWHSQRQPKERHRHGATRELQMLQERQPPERGSARGAGAGGSVRLPWQLWHCNGDPWGWAGIWGAGMWIHADPRDWDQALWVSIRLWGSTGLRWGSVGLGHNPVGLPGSSPSPGLQTLQEVSGCHLLSHGSIQGSHRLGHGGREFLSFQLGSLRFVVADGAAQVTKRRWEHDGIEAEE